MSLIADFSASLLSGSNPLSVIFSDLSIGSPISWDWDFGDGSPHSYLQNPTHIYTVSGAYTVSLSVSDGVLFSTETKSDYITVYISSDFSAIPIFSVTGIPVQFLDESSDIANTYEWNFGDGTLVSIDRNTTHIYTEPGIYTVTLTVSLYGHIATETKINYVTIVTRDISLSFNTGGGFTRLKGPTLIFD